jgi:predicted amidohydrolase YtcJ
VAFGSDGPTNPYLNILFATIHANHPSEAITREHKGSIAAGKLADLAVLSQDIFTVPTTEMPKTRAVLTRLRGFGG